MGRGEGYRYPPARGSAWARTKRMFWLRLYRQVYLFCLQCRTSAAARGDFGTALQGYTEEPHFAVSAPAYAASPPDFGNRIYRRLENTAVKVSTTSPPSQPQARNEPPSAYAAASFSDTIFTLGSPGTGILHVSFDLKVNGELWQESLLSTVIQMGGALLDNDHFNSTHVSGEFPLRGSIPVFGHVEAVGTDSWPSDPNEGSLFGSGSISITSVSLTDLEGNPIPNPPYWSESGTRYFGDQNYVPEPGTGSLALLSLGLVATGLRVLCRDLVK